jgi:hypothetical protein
MEISGVLTPITSMGITGPVGPSGPIDPPDFFVDGARIVFSQASITLMLLRSKVNLSADEQASLATHEAVALLRMSPQMAAQLVTLMSSALDTLQKQFEESEKATEAKAAE